VAAASNAADSQHSLFALVAPKTFTVTPAFPELSIPSGISNVRVSFVTRGVPELGQLERPDEVTVLGHVATAPTGIDGAR